MSRGIQRGSQGKCFGEELWVFNATFNSISAIIFLLFQVLQQELGGDNINIQSLMNQQSSWRGRAQQIIGLQLKVSLNTNNVF